MSDASRIDEAIDATAAIVAAYVPGIRAVYGVGSGLVTIPAGGIMAGLIVPGFVGDPVEPFSHVSDVPTVPTIIHFSATVTQFDWLCPFRIYLDANDQLTLRRRAMALLPLYAYAFSQHTKLAGMTTVSPILPGGSVLIQSFGLFNAEQHGFDGLGGVFQIVERLDFNNVA